MECSLQVSLKSWLLQLFMKQTYTSPFQVKQKDERGELVVAFIEACGISEQAMMQGITSENALDTDNNLCYVAQYRQNLKIVSWHLDHGQGLYLNDMLCCTWNQVTGQVVVAGFARHYAYEMMPLPNVQPTAAVIAAFLEELRGRDVPAIIARHRMDYTLDGAAFKQALGRHNQYLDTIQTIHQDRLTWAKRQADQRCGQTVVLQENNGQMRLFNTLAGHSVHRSSR